MAITAAKLKLSHYIDEAHTASSKTHQHANNAWHSLAESADVVGGTLLTHDCAATVSQLATCTLTVYIYNKVKVAAAFMHIA